MEKGRRRDRRGEERATGERRAGTQREVGRRAADPEDRDEPREPKGKPQADARPAEPPTAGPPTAQQPRERGWLVRLGLKPAGGYVRLAETERGGRRRPAPAEASQTETAEATAGEAEVTTGQPEVSQPRARREARAGAASERDTAAGEANRPQAPGARGPSRRAPIRTRPAQKDGWLVRLGLKPAGGYVGLAERGGEEVDVGEEDVVETGSDEDVAARALPWTRSGDAAQGPALGASARSAGAPHPPQDPLAIESGFEPSARPGGPPGLRPLRPLGTPGTATAGVEAGLLIGDRRGVARWLSVVRQWVGGITAERIIEGGWLLAVVVVPLVYWAAGRDSYELPKQIVLRSILYVALALALTVGLLRWAGRGGVGTLGDPGGSWWRGLRRGLDWLLRWPPFWVALAVNGAWSIATMGSVAPEMSFWGTTNRWSGLRTEWTYGALFLLGAAVMARPAQLTRLAGALAVGGVPIALYALYQWVGPQHPWVIGSGVALTRSRPFGTLGNPIFLADLALFGFFLILGALLGARSRLARGLWAAALFFQVVSLLLPQSRAAWVAVLVGLGVLAMLVAALHGISRRYWLVGPVVAAVVLAGGLWVGQGPLRAVGLGRVADLVNPAEYAAQSRLLQWKAAGLTWLRRPLLGFGPETFESVIERDWDIALQRLGIGDDLVYDRAHNAVLDALVAAGALGGASLLLAGAVLGAHVRRLHAHYRDERAAALALGFGAAAGAEVVREAVVPLCAVAGLVGYLTAQQFGIQTVASAMVAWLVAGGLIGLARRAILGDVPRALPWTRQGDAAQGPALGASARSAGAPHPPQDPLASLDSFEPSARPGGPPGLRPLRPLGSPRVSGAGRWGVAVGGSVAALVLVGLAIPFEVRPLQARLHDDLGVALHRAQRLEEAVAQEEVAVSIWPHNFRHWSELAYALRAAARPKPDPESHPQYRRAVAAAERALVINPVYPRVKAYFGDVAGEAAVRTGDAMLAERAIAAHAEATTEAPLSWRYREMAAQTYFQMRKVDAAKGQLQRAVELWPTNWSLWAALGDAGVLSNDRDTARRAYTEAQKLNPTHEGIQRALAALG